MAMLARSRYLVLWAATLYWFVPRIGIRGGDWHFFADANDLLLGRHPRGFDAPGGLHLFANYPEMHMGPLSVLLAGLFRLAPGDGSAAAVTIMCALAPVLVLIVERAAVASRSLRSALDHELLPLATLVGGLVFVRAWFDVAGPIAHLDDVMVLTAAAVVVWAVANERPWLAGAAVGLAIGGKSWAVVLLPLLGCFPRRAALRSGGLALALGAAAWLPFLIADRGTLAAMRADQGNDLASGLRVFGVDTLTTPHWVRPVQVTIALALATLAVVRGRWAAALLLAVGARLALDPATFTYYMPGLVLGGLVWDLVGSRRPMPLWAPAAYFALATFPQWATFEAQGFARVAIAVAALGLLVRARTPRPATSPAG